MPSARTLLMAGVVTEPRYITPGSSYLITRRCCHRSFRLRPSPLTHDVFGYCLGYALEKTGVILHAECVMSNHHHMVVTDPHGVLPDFLRELHRSTAKALNASQGRWESLWSSEPCNVVRLVDEHDLIDKIVYVATNPVSAGLVSRPEEWPGLLVWTDRPIRIRRPKAYFAEHGASPEWIVLQAGAPPGVSADPSRADSWKRRVQSEIEAKVAAVQRNMRAACRTFLGRAGVLAKSFAQRAKSFEPRRVLVPSVAAKHPEARSAALLAMREFRRAYHAAVTLWKRGVRDVIFPFGTWWMRVHHAATCALPIPAS